MGNYENSENKERILFSPEFKAQAISLVVNGGQTLAEVGQKLGVHGSTVGKWVQQHRKGEGFNKLGGKSLSPLEKENLELKLRVKDLEMTTEILKKSIAILSERKKASLS